MNTLELVKNAIGSNGFTTDDTSAGYVNPSYWDRQVLAFLEEKLVIADKAKKYSLDGDGTSLAVTIDSTPTAAAAVAETDDVSVSAQAHTQVIFSPTEYAKAFQLHDKEARRSFVDQMANMSKKIGYALALARDDNAVTTLVAGAGNTATANGAVSSDITTSDLIDFDDIVNAATLIRADQLVPRYLFVSPGQAGDLAKSAQFARADYAGDSSAFRQGLIGKIYGMEVFETTQIAPSSSKSKAIMLAVDQLGEPCFGICSKGTPGIRTERHELGRYTDIVGVEEWDIEVLRTNGVATLETYDA